MTFVLGIGRIVLALALAPTAAATQADAIAAEAVLLHTEGKLEEASAKLVTAYSLYPDRDYLYMRGVIERESGDCKTAVELFNAFLAESPPLVDVEAAQGQLEKCADTIGTAATPTAAPPPRPVMVAAPEPDVAPPTPARDVPQPRRWWQDRVGGALVGSGLALALVGGGLLGGAAARAQTADRADQAGEYRDGIAVARGLNVAGLTVIGVATSLVIGGVVRWAVIARRPVR
jgi:hypothetical protein